MFPKSEEREKELLSPAIKNRNFISESLKKGEKLVKTSQQYIKKVNLRKKT